MRVFIVGAGSAAHLAGVVAAHTTRPVLGVPLAASDLQGLDALLATVQMPAGIPVGTLAIGKAGAANAAWLAASILALSDETLAARLAEARARHGGRRRAQERRGPGETRRAAGRRGSGLSPYRARHRRNAPWIRRGFHTITLGCKLNQFDSAAIEGELARRGFRAAAGRGTRRRRRDQHLHGDPQGRRRARRLIRSVRRGNPDCRLLVTGCYAELDADGLRATGRRRSRLRQPGQAARWARSSTSLGPRRPATGGRRRPGLRRPLAGLPAALHFGDRSRAFLKVQEGCRLACSYCIIPTRARARAAPCRPARWSGRPSALFESGYREIVLTGVNTGDYGLDLDAAAATWPTCCAGCSPAAARTGSGSTRSSR